MTDPSMTLHEYLRKIGADLEGDFLREGLALLAQMAMDLEVTQQIGAAKHQRTAERTNQRNGTRERPWDTRVGRIKLQIPKLRHGSYFPSLLEPRRRAEKALLNVIQQAYIEGVSTRRVDDLVQALGLQGIDKSLVSRACKELDGLVSEFRKRPLTQRYPYVWLDAIYLKVRQNGRIFSLAAVLAIGVCETGERHILGLALGAGESEPFWTEFLRSLVQQGLQGVQLVISDAHEGLKAAISKVLTGATWQCCRVHFMRNLLAHVPQGDKALVAALVRTVFAQPNREVAKRQVTEVVRVVEARWPKAAAVLLEAEDDVLAYMAFPPEHWTRIYSTNPLERLNREIRRRTDVVGVFPDEAATLRLVGALLIERADEWEVERRPFSLESMRKLTAPDPADRWPPNRSRCACHPPAEGQPRTVSSNVRCNAAVAFSAFQGTACLANHRAGRWALPCAVPAWPGARVARPRCSILQPSGIEVSIERSEITVRKIRMVDSIAIDIGKHMVSYTTS